MKNKPYIYILAVFSVLLIAIYCFSDNLSRSFILPEYLELFNIASAFGFIISALTPLFIFLFYYTTTKLMFTLLDIKMDNLALKNVISYSLVVPLIFTGFYAYCLFSLDIDTLSLVSNAQVADIAVFYSITIGDFTIINNLAWGGFYFTVGLIFFFEYKISLIKSYIAIIVPSLIVYLFKLLF